MTSFWKKLIPTAARRSKYDFSKLISAAYYNEFPSSKYPHQIICDIDKTYLETQFESLIKMAKIALESANEKITVAGAADVLNRIRWAPCALANGDDSTRPRPLHFVSSSPPQLRPVLEQKLFLDGIDWASTTFKNQAYNVVTRRLDQFRQHVGYKSAAILQIIKLAGDGGQFTLFGDNAEWDAYIYLGIALRLNGTLSANTYSEYLRIAGVDHDVANDIDRAFAELPRSSINAIYIRNAPGYTFNDMPPLTDAVTLFDDYFQLAGILAAKNLIAPNSLLELSRRFHNHHGFSRAAIIDKLPRLEKENEEDSQLGDIIENIHKLFANNDNKVRGLALPPSSIERLHQFLSAREVLAAARAWTETIAAHSAAATK